MKRRRVLAFFMAVSVLASTVFPSAAAGLAKDTGGPAAAGTETGGLTEADPADSGEQDKKTDPGQDSEKPSADPETPKKEEPADEVPGGNSETVSGPEAKPDTEAPSETDGADEESEKPSEEPEEEEKPAAEPEEDTQKKAPRQTAAEGEPELLVDFDFENLSGSGDITSGNAKATGTYSVVDSYPGGGKALKLDAGQQQFLAVTGTDGKSLLTGLTEMTVSYEAAYGGTGTDWVMYAAANDTAPTFGQESYIGIMREKNGDLNAERFLNGRPQVVKTNIINDWTHVDVVMQSNATIVYVNGEKKVESTDVRDLSAILGNSSILQIGKANWGGGEYCNGTIDNFRIYDKALTKEQIEKQYDDYLNQGVEETSELTLNAGYVSEDLILPTEFQGTAVTWSSNNTGAISNDGKVTRTDADQEVTLTATIASKEGESTTKEFTLKVLAKGPDALTYVSSSPANGQMGGMKIAVKGDDGKYQPLRRNQPILYTKTTMYVPQGNAKDDNVPTNVYVSPQIFRKAEGTSFGMIAAKGESNTILLYDSKDLISYTNERSYTLNGIGSIRKLSCVYDMAESTYKIFAGTATGDFIIKTKDFAEFGSAQKIVHTFPETEGPADAVWESPVALREAEAETLKKKFSNPQNTGITTEGELPQSITVSANTTPAEIQEALEKANIKATATYSDGQTRKLTVGWNQRDLERIDTSRPGTYTIHGSVGGSVFYTEADAPLIEERADPFITYNKDDGYYYFTASYPMVGGDDPEGYDRLVLRRAKTIGGLADAEEVTIWDESSSSTLGRFIWAPELHKIGDSWYFISTAGLNTGTGTTFDIRPFMIKCNNEGDMMNPRSWGEPVLVKAMNGDVANCLKAMSLDMTYFEANGKHYLVWADFTGGPSRLFIATIDEKDPTQLTSACGIIAIPEYVWEQRRFTVNEGPAVIQNDGKVYLAFSGSGTGSEYCVGVLTGDATADLTKPASWTKTPYPILTSADFDNEVSGPGHNSFTVDKDGQPVIVYHARPMKTHSTGGGLHTGDPLVDPCRHCYVKPIFFDTDGMPILNISEEEFRGSADTSVSIQLIVEGEEGTKEPILEYNFDEAYTGTAADSSGKNHAKLSAGASYVEDEEYGQVLYLDGGKSMGGSNSFLEFPEGFFDGKDSLTISMDVNAVTRSGNFFTFTIGQDNQKYLFLKTDPTHMKLAVTKSGSPAEQAAEKSFKYPNNSRTWINVKMVLTPSSISVYQDGKLAAIKRNTGIKLSDLGTGLKAYVGKSFYSADQYFRGYFDNIKVYDWAMTDEEVKMLTEQDAAERKAKAGELQRVADRFSIPNAERIKGNISLPSEINGVTVAWSSDHEDIISPKSVTKDGYTDAPAGVVTRQAEDTKVTLTAVFSKDGQSVTKTYPLTVKAKPEPLAEEDYVGYLFVHFTGTEEDGTKEQTYFSMSEDGLYWEDLNDNQPVLTSTFGESGLRDHFIARSAEGDRFYMIATDLSIANNKATSWPGAGADGSHSIVVWESDDLVNWSDPWLAEIAPEGAGCTWAPEFIYDKSTGEYVVYWSSTTLKVDGNENIVEDYENHAIYYCKTRDFRTFTETKLYHKGEGVKVIDSTMIEHDGTYYRYTKNETAGTIEIDKSDSVLGNFTKIPSGMLSTDLPASQGAVEGPIIFKLNERTKDGKEQWCLLVDRFARGQGYYPLVTTDLASGEFTMLADGKFRMPSKYRHGYVMPVTEQEYTALQMKWGDKEYDQRKVIDKSKSGNPMLGFDGDGNILYGGDPSILVDGDTVYCYVGHDSSPGEFYQMPDWHCYSSTDMLDWKYEGMAMSGSREAISWAKDDVSAWAGQVAKYNGKYYFYYCTETIAEHGGGKSVGVAVADSPTGPFKDIGKPLVRNIDTTNSVHGWEDIDPTVWIETDEKGEEHRYLGWGNTRFFVCELNEDMISVKNRDGKDGISCGYADEGDFDIVVGRIDGNKVGKENKVWFGENDEHFYIEAPYYYRQQNEKGEYTGPYYMFFACDWREQMAYATTYDIMSNNWTFGGVLMEPSATGNTNHMAVFDFKGKTYFVYHDGSLPHGSGFRRVACVEEITINEDGTIDPIRKTATGLIGTVSTITDQKGNYLAIKDFENVLDDAFYPITGKELLIDYFQSGVVTQWEVNPGKANPRKGEYVSLESDAKPGLYVTAGDRKSDGTIPLVLSQDVWGSDDEALRMTFKTKQGAEGEGVRFESVKYPGYYMVNRDGRPVLVQNPQPEEAVFYVSTDETVKKDPVDGSTRSVQKTVRFYTAGEELKTDDIRVMLRRGNGTTEKIEDVTVINADQIDMKTPGDKKLEVSYQDSKGKKYTEKLTIHVVEADYRGQ